MNKNIETMKNTLTGYKKQREDAEARIKSITETYGKEAGERERERQEKQLAAARANAAQTIRAAGAEGLAAVRAWGQMDGSKLTDDAKLLDAGLVSVEEFNRLKGKYSSNATMLAALRKYADKQNAAAREEAQKGGDAFTGAMTQPYDVKDMPTADSKRANWEKTQAHALDLLDSIDGTGKYADSWTGSFGRAALPEQLEHFGEGRDY